MSTIEAKTGSISEPILRDLETLGRTPQQATAEGFNSAHATVASSSEGLLSAVRTALESISMDITKTQANTGIDTAEESPKTFREMFQADPKDSFMQRIKKAYLKPRGNPETTIRVLEALQVDQFQKIPKILKAKRSVRKIGARHQSAQTIRDSSLSSLIDYGVNKSGHNEFYHLGGLMATSVIPASALAIVDSRLLLIASPILALEAIGNAYCILAQRYSRARIEQLIDRRLKRGNKMGEYKYDNHLNLKLPK